MAVSILSVSYEPMLLWTRQMILRQEGYEVTSAVGFTQAALHCNCGGFDLMILGHSIPSADEQALIDLFHAHCHAPIVSLVRAGEAVVEGADYRLSPDDPAKLVNEIRAILHPVGAQCARA